MPNELTGPGAAIGSQESFVRRNRLTLFAGFGGVGLGLFLLFILVLDGKDVVSSGLSLLLDCVGLIGLAALAVLTAL